MVQLLCTSIDLVNSVLKLMIYLKRIRNSNYWKINIGTDDASLSYYHEQPLRKKESIGHK